MIGLLVVTLAGCSSGRQDTPQQQPPGEQQQPQQTAAPVPPEQPAPTPSEPVQPAGKTQKPSPPARTSTQKAASPKQVAPENTPPPTTAPAPGVGNAAVPPSRTDAVPVAPPAPLYAAIPAGTAIAIRLVDPLDSGVNKPGDAFRGTLDKDLVVEGDVAAPRGTAVFGKLSNVQQSGRVEGRAAMSLQLTELKIGDQVIPITTNVLAFEAESTKKQDAAKVGIGAGIGAVIGAIAGGGKGAAIGAAVGGGAGGATVIATRGKELKFDPEHRFSFSLQRDIKVRIR
jgi:hypothetical protein